MNIIKRIDEMIEEKSLLKHPFYEKWSAGELTQESLAGYSKEYFQIVKTVPSFMDKIIDNVPAPVSGADDAATNELNLNRQEEYEHIESWIVFADKLGISRDELSAYEGLPKTRKAISNLDGLMGETYLGGVSAMYAFEKEIPKISQTKMDGLSEFYGMPDGDDAMQYFRLHVEADIRHAASWREIILDGCSDEYVTGNDNNNNNNNNDVVIDSASESIAAQNLLLDGCYEEYCQ